MTRRRYKVFLEYDESSRSWVTYVPALDHISTFGDTREEAISNTEELIAGYLEALAKEGLPAPDHIGETEIVEVEVATA